MEQFDSRSDKEQLAFPSWYILSAKYELLSPNDKIEGYELSLTTMKAKERRDWAEKVFEDILKITPRVQHVTFLAGLHYRKNLNDLLVGEGIKTCIPMEGLRIGEQLRWLERHAK